MKKDAQQVTQGQWIIFIVSAVVIFTIICGIGYSSAVNRSSNIPVRGSTIDLRGDRFLLLRNVTTRPYFGLGIHLDGTVSLFPYPERRGTIAQVTDKEWANISLFREQWCNDTIIFSENVSGTKTYDLGVRCSDHSYFVTQVTISSDDIPAAVGEIIQRLQLTSP